MELIPKGKKLILGSKSPRRQQLMRELGYEFETRSKDIDESHPDFGNGTDTAEFLAEKKAEAFREDLADNEIVLTSDTIVWCDGESLAKAEDEEHARQMLQKLSGRSHEVITAVCLLSKNRREVFSSLTKVFFRPLTEAEIEHYITQFRPFDKAGAYGIQEWIGMWAIEKIEGSYFNVVGLPTHLVAERLAAWDG